MPVTTGTTTTKTSGGPSGGPGGGSLQAPNRTAPSTGTLAGAKAGAGGGGKGSTGASSAPAKTSSPQTSAPGKTDKNPQTSNTAAKSDKVGTSTISKTPASQGGIRSPTQQAKVNEMKQAYTDYGGAYTTVAPPKGTGGSSKPTQSAKVVDPARSTGTGGGNKGTTSSAAAKNGSGTSTAWGGSKPQTTAGGKTDPQPTKTATASPVKSGTTPARGSGTDTAWGGNLVNPQRSAPGKTSMPGTKTYGSGTDSAWGGDPVNPQRTAGGKTSKPSPTVAKLSGTSQDIARDPSISGRLAEANRNYSVTTGPGGLVSRTYADPDLGAASGTGTMERLTRSLQGVGETLRNAVDGPLRGPNRGLVGKTLGEELAEAGAGAFNRIAGGLRDTGDYIGSLLGAGGIAPGATTSSMMNTPGMTPGNPRPGTGFGYEAPVSPTPAGSFIADGSIMGMQPNRRSMTAAQAIAQDPIGYNGPRAGAAPPSVPNPSVTEPSAERLADLNNRLAAAQQGQNLAPFGNVRKDPARVEPEAPNYATVTDPRLAQLQEQFERIAQARGQRTNLPSIPEPDSLGIMPGIRDPRIAQAQEQLARPAPITSEDIGGVFDNGAIPDPTGVEELIQQLAPQPTTPVRQGTITNPFFRDPAAQAQGVRNAVALALGQAPRPAPAPAPRQPTEVNIGMPTSVGGGLGFPGYTAPIGLSSQRIIGSSPANLPGQRDEMYGGGPTRAQASPADGQGDGEGEASSPRVNSPSQEGDYPPDENFVQDAGQPQSIRELYNRYKYEKEQAKEGFKELPGRLWDAITRGDVRPYDRETNDKREPRKVYGSTVRSYQNTGTEEQAVLLAQLLALMQQQQSGIAPSQMDLVYNTFV